MQSGHNNDCGDGQIHHPTSTLGSLVGTRFNNGSVVLVRITLQHSSADLDVS
jgi:hypothetical protein